MSISHIRVLWVCYISNFYILKKNALINKKKILK